MYPSELELLGKHMKSTVLFYQNFRLIGEAGYWDISAQLKPLLHFWSLSIEEQFYVFWPVILILLHKFRLNLFFSLIFIFIVLIIVGQLMEIDHFYHSLSRFWELSFGGLVYAITLQFNFKYLMNKIHNFVYILLVTSFFLANGNSEFNFIAALSIVISTAILILILLANPHNKFFASTPVVFLGLISFPLYLWHYVIISYMHIFNLNVVNNGFWIILVSILISYLTYRYVELYARKQKSYKFATILFLLGLAIVVFLGQKSFLTKGFEDRQHVTQNKQIKQQFEKCIDNKESGILLFEKITGHKPQFKTIQLQATSTDLTKKYVVLMGDSHAYSAYDGFAEEFQKKGYETLLLGNPGCRGYPKTSLDYKTASEDCKNGIDETYKALEQFNNVEKIVFISMIPRHLSSINDLYQHFSQKNRYQTYYLIANPTLDFFPDSCSIRPFTSSPMNKECRMSYSKYNTATKQYKEFAQEAAKKFKNIIILDATSLFCDNDFCYPIRNGSVLYKDDNHLSVKGSKSQAEYLINHIFSTPNK